MSHVTNRESCENFRRSEEANRRREARHLFFLSSLGGAFLFVLTLGFTMFFMHPVCLGISLVCALAYSARLEGWRALGRQLRYLLPVLLFTALLNPLFNHQGATVFLRLPNGSPFDPGGRQLRRGGGGHALLAVIVWFRCFGAVITSDKFLLPLRPDGAGLVPAPVHGVSLRAPVPSPYAGGLPRLSRTLAESGSSGPLSPPFPPQSPGPWKMPLKLPTACEAGAMVCPAPPRSRSTG